MDDNVNEIVNVDELKITDDMFIRVGTKGLDAERISKPSITFWSDFWRRFRKNKLALLGLVIISLVIFLVIAGPTIAQKNYQFIDTAIKNQSPNKEYWFGTDELGRDIFTRVCYGGRQTAQK